MYKPQKEVYVLIGIFLIYLVSVILNSNFWGNILSPLVAFIATFIIYKSIDKINPYKKCWLLICLSTLSWGIADLCWLFFDGILLISPIQMAIIDLLYLIPNLFLVLALTVYYNYNLKKWNMYQLILDIVSISAILIVILWTVIFSRVDFQFHSYLEYLNVIIYVFFNFYLISGITVAYISKKINNLDKSFFFIFAGILISSLADYYYSYVYLMNLYQPNTIIDAIYMLSIILFALGAEYKVTHPTIKENVCQNELSENLRKPQKLTFILISLLIFSYFINLLTFKLLIVCVSICLLHWIFSTHIKTGASDKHRLKTELQINEYLEKIVDERTRELTIANKHLEEISNKDSLTGLYNHRYLVYYLDLLITKNKKKPFALLYVDINRFKSINDSYGHEIGDKLLCALSNRFLESCLPNCKIFRIGGDEFAVIVENRSDKSYIGNIAEKILSLIENPIPISSYSFSIGASIGIAMYPEDARNKDILMRYADTAMYEAKNNCHENHYLFFDSELSQKSERKREIEFLLKNIDYDKEFVLYYQPQYSIKDHSLIGMEALIRWIPPGKNTIYPTEFIPIAEESGAIIKIGEWVINNAFNQIKQWNNNYCLNLKMSINVSPIQIENINFINWLSQKITKENIDTKWIDLEITENSAMNPNVSFEKIFDLFANLGICTSIDDFGTGYSSLSYIKRFNINRLKIAKELIDNISEDKNALLIVQAIIMMAKGMGLTTLAEGIENKEQLEILEKLECDEIQSYIHGEPVTFEKFEELHIKPIINQGSKS